jgi:hypothetical protein
MLCRVLSIRIAANEDQAVTVEDLTLPSEVIGTASMALTRGLNCSGRRVWHYAEIVVRTVERRMGVMTFEVLAVTCSLDFSGVRAKLRSTVAG